MEELRGSVAGRGNNGVLYTPANPGPLNRDIAETFAGGSYTEVVINKKTIFYRVYGGDANKVGRYMTRIPQNGGMQAQYEGRVALQAINDGAGQLLGGGNQVYIPEVNAIWFVN